MLEPRAPNPGRVLERGRNNPWAAEQTAMGFKSISLQIDISKGARRRDRAETWGTRPRKEGMEWRAGWRQILDSLSTETSPEASAGRGKSCEGY